MRGLWGGVPRRPAQGSTSAGGHRLGRVGRRARHLLGAAPGLRRASRCGACSRSCRSSWSRNSSRDRCSASTAVAGSSVRSKRSARSPSRSSSRARFCSSSTPRTRRSGRCRSRSVLAGGTMAVLIMVGVRFGWRMDYDRQLRRRMQRRECERVIVFGGGERWPAPRSRRCSPTARARTSRSRSSTTIPSCAACAPHGVKVVGDRYDMAARRGRVPRDRRRHRGSQREQLARPRAFGARDEGGSLGARAAVGARAARRRRARRRHPRADRARPPGPPLDRDRPRPGRVVPARQARAGDGCGRIDRFRALPPDRALRAGRAPDGRPRRVRAARGAAVDQRSGAARHARRRAARHPRP